MIEDTQMNIPDANSGMGDISQQATEKMIPQSKVDEIARSTYAKAIEKGRNEAMAQMSQANAPVQQQSAPGMTPESIQQMIAQETRKSQEAVFKQAQEEALMQRVQQVVTDFDSKMQSGSSAYEDFKDTIEKLPSYEKIAPIVGFASSLDNTADVMYELAKNPLKLGSIMQLAAISSDHAAEEMRKLSNSIKSNSEAKRVEMSNEPLRQIKSSPNSTDTGSMSVTDYRKIYR